MKKIWQKNISTCHAIIQANLGPKIVNVVSGSHTDQIFWQERLSKTRKDLFNSTSDTRILSSLESTRKGNFLGSVNAWMEIQKVIEGMTLPPMMLMNMVFGLGKRLSPLPQ